MVWINSSYCFFIYFEHFALLTLSFCCKNQWQRDHQFLMIPHGRYKSWRLLSNNRSLLWIPLWSTFKLYATPIMMNGPSLETQLLTQQLLLTILRIAWWTLPKSLRMFLLWEPRFFLPFPFDFFLFDAKAESFALLVWCCRTWRSMKFEGKDSRLTLPKNQQTRLFASALWLLSPLLVNLLLFHGQAALLHHPLS